MDFVHAMQQASASATQTIAVLSPAHLESQFAESEPGFTVDHDLSA